MNAKQKEQIMLMRQDGLGYSKIAQKLTLSENSIKSYCKRKHLNGYGSELSLSAGTKCRNCGITLEQPSGQKQRKFCSDNCRVVWWNTHPEYVNKKAIYHIVCAHCGISFESYGNKSRKFCSHSCYIADRFGAKREVGSKL